MPLHLITRRVTEIGVATADRLKAAEKVARRREGCVRIRCKQGGEGGVPAPKAAADYSTLNSMPWVRCRGRCESTLDAKFIHTNEPRLWRAISRRHAGMEDTQYCRPSS